MSWPAQRHASPRFRRKPALSSRPREWIARPQTSTLAENCAVVLLQFCLVSGAEIQMSARIAFRLLECRASAARVQEHLPRTRSSCAHERQRRASAPREAHHRGRCRVLPSKTHKARFVPFAIAAAADPSCNCGRRQSRNIFLARDKRDITVPIGTESVSAIS